MKYESWMDEDVSLQTYFSVVTGSQPLSREREAELAERRAALEAAGGYPYPASQTPWQEIQRALVGQLDTGAILEGAEKYQRIAQTMGLPRDNH